MPDQTSQAPVAGADPRADGWKALAEMADHHAGLVWDSSTSHGHARTLLRSAAAALLTAAEERETRTRVAADREQQLTEVAERWRRLEAERTAELQAAAARGAAGERVVLDAWLDGVSARHWTNWPESTDDAPRWSQRIGFPHATLWEAAAARYVAALGNAPRPSAGPAAPCVRCGRSYRGQDGPFAGAPCPAGDLCCTPLAVSPAARASDEGCACGFDKRGADRLADEVVKLVRRGVIDARSPAGDALLDYRNPPVVVGAARASDDPAREVCPDCDGACLVDGRDLCGRCGATGFLATPEVP